MDGKWREVDTRRILIHTETKLWILVPGWKMEKVDYNRQILALPETEMRILIN